MLANGEWVVLVVRGGETWIQSTTGEQPLAAISGDELTWGRLGLVVGEVRLIAQTIVGPVMFDLASD